MASIKQLESQIEQLNIQLGKARQNSELLKADMESGHWGTQQIAEFKQSIETLRVAMNGLANAKQYLNAQLSEKLNFTTNYGTQTNEFDKLAAKMETTATKIQASRNKIESSSGEFARGTLQGSMESTKLRNLENQLRRYETEARRKYTSLGTSKPSGYDDWSVTPDENLLRRQESPAYTYGDADIAQRAGSRQSRGRTYSLTGTRTDPIYERLKNPISTGASGYIAGGFSGPGGVMAGEEAPVKKLIGSLSETELLKSVADKYKKAVKAASEAMNKAGLAITEGAVAIEGKEGAFSLKARNSDPTALDIGKNYEIFTNEMGTWGRSLKELANKQFAMDNPALTEFARQKGGFEPADRLHSKLDAAGTYTEHTYRKLDEYGVQKQGSFRTDPQGQITQAPAAQKFRSFAQGVGKDLGDLAKWSIAIAAIYGPINAATEAIKEMIVNESKLADVSIALNKEVATTGQVFDAVYSAAKRSGESVSGVIDAFGMAFTAAGRITNEFDRYNTTVKLLDDSLKLSKLSTLDQAQAIDVLTAALYQTAQAPGAGENISPSDQATQALSRGSELIDKWIKVSKIASVDVATLATGVAVLGDSAETAGVGIEELNAMIATLAEVSTGTSGKEIANVAKALIGNYQTATAVKELNRLGIAVTDTSGKTREFLDVMKDVSSLRTAGIIGNQDFQRLTLSLGGGGIRRQKDVAAFIENFGRMNQIKDAQFGGGGESADALAKKLDTVQTSTTNLTNAFTSLAQTMGNEGGLLDTFSSLLGVGTSIVEMMDKLAGGFGKMSPLLLGTGIGALLLRGKGGAAGIQSSLMNNLNMGGLSSGLLTGVLNPFDQMQRRLNPNGVGMGAFGMQGMLGKATTLPALAAIGLPAYQNFKSGDNAEGAANIVGGIAGALTAGPVGALVGSSIAESFVRTTLTYDTQFSDFFAGVVKPDKTNKLPSPLTGEKSIEEMTSDVFKTIGGAGGEAYGKYLAKSLKEASDLQAKYGSAGLISGATLIGKNAKDLPGQFETEGAAAMYALEQKDPKQAAALKARFAREGTIPKGEATRLTTEQERISNDPEQAAYLRKIQKERMAIMERELLTGKLKESDYSNRADSLSAFSMTAPRFVAALGKDIGGVGDAFKSSEDAYKAFLEILSSGNEESITQINSYIAEIDYLQNMWDNWNPDEKTAKFTLNGQDVVGSKSDLGAAITNKVSALDQYSAFAAQNARLQRLDIRDVYGSNTEGVSNKDIRTNTADTVKAQEKLYSNLKKEDYVALQESWEPFFVLVEEAGKSFYKQVVDASGKKVDKSLYGELWQANEKSGRVSGGAGGADWNVLGATPAQLNAALAQEPGKRKSLESKGYQSKVEEVILETTDKQTSVQHVDMKVLSYLLQQILDTEKKQLQGIWNLPEGSSFWVPLQSMIAGNGSTGGVTGSDKIDASKYQKTSDMAYSGIPGEELTMYGYKDLPDLIKNISTKKEETTLTSTAKEDYFSKILGGHPRGERPIGSEDSKVAAGGGTGTLQQLIDTIQTMFGLFMGTGIGISPTMGPSGPIGGVGGVKGGSGDTAALNTKLDIKFTSTTNLMVDGRVLASIVKPYLAADLMRANESGGTVTKAYVI